MLIKTFTPARPEFEKVAKELYQKAVNYERNIAADWRAQLNKYNKNGEYNDLLSISNDWLFLRRIVEEFGAGYNSNASLKRSKKLDPKKYDVPFKVYGKYVIQKPDGTYLAGEDLKKPTHPISEARIKQIHGLYDYMEDWIVDRLLPVVWEEVGQEILQDYTAQKYGKTGVQVEESDDWKYDFVMKFPPGTYRDTIINYDGREYQGVAPATDWRFDYKTDLNNIHIADKKLDINGDDVTTNLYDIICVSLLKNKLEGLYPTFISLQDSGQIVFSSEILQDAHNFYLTEPPLLSQTYIEEMAEKLYENYKMELIDRVQYSEGMKNLANQGLSEVVMKHLDKSTIKGSLWYGRNGQYR